MKVLTPKKVIEEVITDVEDEGLMSLLGQRITVFCMNYFYTGKLIGVNKSCVKLEDAYQVFETGPFSDSKWKDAQKLPNDWYVSISSIESFGILK